MNLVIVESPAKGRTIEKYLGPGYKVAASFGHVRDLPQGELGVDVDNDFEPKYVISPKSRKTITTLKGLVKTASKVYLATDYDREGEAIAYHLVEALNNKKISDFPVNRITFHEITKEAINEAIKHPRRIDMDLVNAQQARRVLDRLVGYKLSPFLWKKIYRGLSAGRVQSVAVRLVVDREREIGKFTPEEYWTIVATLKGKSDLLEASLTGKNGKKIEKLGIKSVRDADEIFKDLKVSTYKVSDIVKKQERRWPSAPFITSTLQQDASYKLGFSAKKTMKLAQDLYEEGQITYMRTDSTNLSTLAITAARKLIENEFGKQYLPESAPIYKTKVKGAQEAHEAIRPTHIESHKGDESPDDHERLYNLIWQRTVASQMKPAEIDATILKITASGNNNYQLESRGATISFPGFSRVWPIKIEEKKLPILVSQEELDLEKLDKIQHFTEPPARFTEATLIKMLEEKGIGRPSTYAPTLSTIEDRGYIRKEKRVLIPNEIGLIVTDLLVKHFSDIVDLDFTKKMEEDLDEIAEGKAKWQDTLKNFYEPFEKNLNKKYDEVEKSQIIKVEETEEVCPKCGKKMVIRMGRFGKFLACSGFPSCKQTKQIIVKTGLPCPECGKGDVIERKTKRGKTFWGCSNWPNCKWASWVDPRKTK